MNGEYHGRKLAKEDYQNYKDGKMTKEDIANACSYAKLAAAWGDQEAQEIGYYYLVQMEELGFIKNLRRVD